MKKRFLFLLLFISSFFYLSVANAKETEMVTNEELSNYEVIEPITINFVNPLYSDVITVDDLAVGGKPNLYALSKATEYHTSIDSAAEELRQAMKNREGSITIHVKSTEQYSALLGNIFSKATEHTGVPTEGDYINWQYGGWRAKVEGIRTIEDYKYYDFTYTLTYYTTKEQEAELDKEISKLMKSLNLTGTNYEKITKIYNYIINNVTYDYDHLEAADYKLQYTAYAALINKTSVCQGYAVLLYRLALENGIDARLIAGYGNGGSHGWNIIKLGKYYYNVDATWDASYAKYNVTPYYLKSNANFSNHTRSSEYDTTEFNNVYKMSDYDYSEQPDKEEINGLQYNESTKNWEYYVNGKFDKNYNGIATNENGIWIIDNGIITFKHNEVILYNNKWYAFRNSKLSTSYTGLGTNKSGTWYVKNGLVDFKYNGTYKDSTGNIYIIKNSKVDTTVTEVRSVDSIWYYFKNGKTALNYTGLGTNKSGTWYVKNGLVDFKYNGTYKDLTGNIYIIKNSKVDTTITEVRSVDSTWYYFENGKTALNYTGLGTNKSGTWYIKNGIVDFKYNGTYKDLTGNIYIIKNSKVDTTVTEVRNVDGIWYYFKNGKTALNYTGLGTNKSGTWYVKNGKVDFKYNGTYKDSTGKTYTIKNSKVI